MLDPFPVLGGFLNTLVPHVFVPPQKVANELVFKKHHYEFMYINIFIVSFGGILKLSHR